MMMTANYLLTAYVAGEQYLFLYEDSGDVWEVLEDFYRNDYPETLSGKKGAEYFALDVTALDDGHAIRVYELAFNASIYHYFFDHGRITLDRFDAALKEDRKTLDTEKKDYADDDLVYVRVLEQDTCDQIRIGHTFPVFGRDLDKAAENTRKGYDERLSWCGGWTDENNNKYHQRIALVDAETLKGVREIWNKKEEAA